VFERFTDRARRVVVLAQEEARELNHNWIGTEHLLLGLIREGEGVAARALESLGVSLADVRREIVEIIDVGENPVATGHVPFTPRSKKILELSLLEARQLGHDYIGTEHILLGIVREGDGVAAQVLQKKGLTLPVVRQEVLQILVGYTGMEVGETGEEHVIEAPRAVGWTGYRPRGGPRWLPRRGRASGPRFAACSACGRDLSESAAYRVLAVPAADSEGSRDVLIVFCTSCGTTVAGHVLPIASDRAEGRAESDE
jgi:ATP-dependent Clp protease ATP-binding subunit ClpA